MTIVQALFGGVPTKPTWKHVSRHGRPAPALGDEICPSYESERGTILVMDALCVFRGAQGKAMMLPRSYAFPLARSPDGDLTSLHDDPDAIWSWRPLLYDLRWVGIQRLGSQQEQEYRIGVTQAQQWTAAQGDLLGEMLVEHARRLPAGAGKNARKRAARAFADAVARMRQEEPVLPFMEANRRADTLLLENLSPQQKIDLRVLRGFYVRGEINRLYFVELGNGFQAVDPVTHETTVSFCLHPEQWIPTADVALATKLGIDAGGKAEAELLGAANARPTKHRPAKNADRIAYEREEHYRFYP